MPSIESLSFDLSDCRLERQGEDNRTWVNSKRVAHSLRFYSTPPPWPFDLTDPGAAARFYGQQCADNKGAMLSMDVTTLAGVDVLRGLFKYRAPSPGSLAMYYVGILWIPFERCSFQVNVEAMERGTTGGRAAAVYMIERSKRAQSPEPAPTAPPIRVKNAQEMFARMRETPVQKAPSDDAQYDAAFPEHPLSMVRARLSTVAETLSLDASMHELRPFRTADLRGMAHSPGWGRK